MWIWFFSNAVGLYRNIFFNQRPKNIRTCGRGLRIRSQVNGVYFGIRCGRRHRTGGCKIGKEWTVIYWPVWYIVCWSSSPRWNYILPSAGWGCTCRRNSSRPDTSLLRLDAAAWSVEAAISSVYDEEARLKDTDKAAKANKCGLPDPKEWSRSALALSWQSLEARTYWSGWGSSSHSGKPRRPRGVKRWGKTRQCSLSKSW